MENKSLLEIVVIVKQRVKDLTTYLDNHNDLSTTERTLIEDVIKDYKQQLEGFDKLKAFMKQKADL